MIGASTFDRWMKAVESFGRTRPDVEVTTTWGQPTLKVRGKMFVCMASHKSAEPNTLVVMMDFGDRAHRRVEGPRRWRPPLRQRQSGSEVRWRFTPWVCSAAPSSLGFVPHPGRKALAVEKAF